MAFRNVLFSTPQGFATLEKKKEGVYQEETTFCSSLKGLESLEYAERKYRISGIFCGVKIFANQSKIRCEPYKIFVFCVEA